MNEDAREIIQRIPAGVNIEAAIQVAAENRARQARNEAADQGMDFATDNKAMQQAKNLFEMFADKKGFDIDELTAEQASEISTAVVDIMNEGDFEDSDEGNRKAVEALYIKLGGDPKKVRGNN